MTDIVPLHSLKSNGCRREILLRVYERAASVIRLRSTLDLIKAAQCIKIRDHRYRI